MLAHVSIQCADAPASRAFYEAVLEPLGGKPLRDFGDHVGFGRELTGGLFWLRHLAFHTWSGKNDERAAVATRTASILDLDNRT